MLATIFKLLAIALFILPPIINAQKINTPNVLDFSNVHILLISILQAISSIIIVIFFDKLNTIDYNKINEKRQVEAASIKNILLNTKSLATHLNIATTLVTFGSLVLIQVLLQLICVIFKVGNINISIAPIKNSGYIIAILSLYFSALGEEFLYRVFLMDALYSFIPLKYFAPLKISQNKYYSQDNLKKTTPTKTAVLNKKDPFLLNNKPCTRDKKILNLKTIQILPVVINFLILIIGALLFATPHIYEGFISVINALIAHFILYAGYKKVLQRCNNKIKSAIYIGTAHFFYNLFCLVANILTT